MDINRTDCPFLRCPSFAFQSHDTCHLEGLRLQHLKKLANRNKENIHPKWIFEFHTRELALASLFFECKQDQDFDFYAFKLKQFNDLYHQFLRVRNFL